MRRAVSILALVALCLLFFATRPRAASDQGKVLNGIALLDYSGPPKWKVGSWVQYKMEGQSEMGHRDDYMVTIVIAGEEVFWGDTCFWLETWTQHAGRTRRAVASLVSYSVFSDSIAWARPQLYVRKVINGLDEEGVPRQELYLRGADTFKIRNPIGSDRTRTLDTLGWEQTSVPAGSYKALKVHRKYWSGGSVVKGDSTLYDESHDDTDSYFSSDVPLTHMVKQHFESVGYKKSWLVGQSQDAPMRVVDKGEGTVSLIGFGRDTTAALIPENVRKPVARSTPKRTQATAAKKSG
jgi:hypothetical protein